MTSQGHDDMFEVRLPIFYTKNDDDFWQCELCVKALFRRKDLIWRYIQQGADRKTGEKILAVIVPSLGDKALTGEEDCYNTIETWEKLLFR